MSSLHRGKPHIQSHYTFHSLPIRTRAMPAAPPQSCALLPPLLAVGALTSLALALAALHFSLRRRLPPPRALKRAAALCLLYTLALALLSLPAPLAPAFSPCAAPRADSNAEAAQELGEKDGVGGGNEVGGWGWARGEENWGDGAGGGGLSRGEEVERRDAEAEGEGTGKAGEARAREAGEEREIMEGEVNAGLQGEVAGAAAGDVVVDTGSAATTRSTGDVVVDTGSAATTRSTGGSASKGGESAGGAEVEGAEVGAEGGEGGELGEGAEGEEGAEGGEAALHSWQGPAFMARPCVHGKALHHPRPIRILPLSLTNALILINPLTPIPPFPPIASLPPPPPPLPAQNEARNLMLEHARREGAQWVLALDGNQFLTAEAWRLIVQAADRHEKRGFKVFKDNKMGLPCFPSTSLHLCHCGSLPSPHAPRGRHGVRAGQQDGAAHSRVRVGQVPEEALPAVAAAGRTGAAASHGGGTAGRERGARGACGSCRAGKGAAGAGDGSGDG
ncbi:unnamed protein product [Closterium sp. NIES-54]